jgi:hypothetical protein
MCHDLEVCDYRRGMGWNMALLHKSHHSELQIITAPPLISTFYISLQHPLSFFPACNIFNGRSLATASNDADSSASRPQVLLS